MMKVFVVVANEGYGVQGVFANKVEAEKCAKYANWCFGCEGGNANAWVEEREVANEFNEEEFEVEEE